MPFPGHISAFIPQTLQGQNISRSQPPAGGGGARPIIQHTAPNMRPNIHNAAGTARPNIHSVGPSMRPNIQSGVTNVRPGMHIASVRPGMHNTGQHSVDQTYSVNMVITNQPLFIHVYIRSCTSDSDIQRQPNCLE